MTPLAVCADAEGEERTAITRKVVVVLPIVSSCIPADW